MVDSIKEKIKNGEGSCYILKGDEIVYQGENGSSYRILKLFSENKEVFRNSFFADRLIGKATAAVVIAGGVSKVYAYNMSKKAIAFFQANDICFSYDNEVENIMNDEGTGLCPLEIAVSQIYEPTLCVEAARNTITILENNKK